MTTIPTKSEQFAILIEHLRKGQEAAAMIAHLHAENDAKDRLLAKGWLVVSEGLKSMQNHVTKLAMGRLN